MTTSAGTVQGAVWPASGAAAHRGSGPLETKALGVQMFRRDRASESEFVTISFRESMATMAHPKVASRILRLRDATFLIEVPERVRPLAIVACHGSPLCWYWHMVCMECHPAGGCPLADELQCYHSERTSPMAKINPIELQKHLKGMDYPASKQDVIDKAKENGADQELQSTLERLPDEQFETPAEVSKAIGGLDE